MTSIYPKTEREALVDRGMIESYLGALFGALFYRPDHFVNVRGIGEKGTDREGSFQEDCWAQPGLAGEGVDPDDMLAASVESWCRVWAQHNVASYIVPAVLKEARGRAESVALMPAVMVDLDSGDTTAKGAWLVERLGVPSMTVFSGGVTEAGTRKMHLYWVLDEPTDQINRVVDLRHEIARKAGGDLQFGRGTPENPYGRAHQPIRIPGTVHAKGDRAQRVELAGVNDERYDLDVLAEAVRRMEESPWAVRAQASSVPVGFDFGPTKNVRPDIAKSLTTEIHAGGDEDRTRWSEFSRVAGHRIRMVRDGQITLAEARDAVHGWVLEQMKPPWPESRIDREWRALVARDESVKGPLPATATDPAAAAAGIIEPGREQEGLRSWATARWTQEAPPKRKFLVEGMVLGGKPHLFVAEGGAGKTFSMLDLCLQVAHGQWEPAVDQETGEVSSDPFEGERTDGAQWLGMPLLAKPGTVVMLTTEDDADELHIRLAEIDPEGRRFLAGDRLIVVPAVNTPRGPFTFGDRDRATGNVVPSAGWREFVERLAELPDLRLVVVDTLNTTLHGEENSATVVNEYAKLLAPVCGKLGAALIVTHHIRKQDAKFPIKTAEDMMNSVRGSSALPAAFRAVFGMWHCPSWGKVLPVLGEKPRAKALWCLAVLKANNPQMQKGIRYLLRGETGALGDVTERVESGMKDEGRERKAWLIAAVGAAADAGAPYRNTSKDSPFSLYGRRNELHPCLREGARTKLQPLVDELIDAGDLLQVFVECQDTRGRIREYPVLDVAGGRYDCEKPERVDEATRWTPPAWDAGYEFDPMGGSIVRRGAPKMAFGGAE